MRVLSNRELAERMGQAARERAETLPVHARGVRGANGRARRAGRDGAMKPRVLFVGRTRYGLPLAGWLERKWSAVGHALDYHVLASEDTANTGSDPRFSLLPASAVADGALFYIRLPFRIRSAIRRSARRRSSPRIRGRRRCRSSLARCPARRSPVICEVHGDWRHSTRLYGSEGRRLLSPLVDALDRYGVRHADAVRALSLYTAPARRSGARPRTRRGLPDLHRPLALHRGPGRPLPERPTALFVGVLERYKNVDGLVAAWRRVAKELPDARLVVVGKGPLRAEVDALARGGTGRRATCPSSRPRRSRRRSTTRRCSSSPRATRASAAS